MPDLKRLVISDLRLIERLEIEESKSYNLIHGKNGVGKTTTLEAIYLLGYGRSFRTNQVKQLIRNGRDKLMVGASDTRCRFKVVKDTKKTTFYVNDQRKPKREVVLQLPIKRFIPQDYQFIEGRSTLRRQFIDWGVFYNQPQYLPVWSKLMKALKQRNLALKNDDEKIKYWDNIFVGLSKEIHNMRKKYWDSIANALQEKINEVVDVQGVHCEYWPGWTIEQDLERILENNRTKDRVYGHTSQGAHRADIHMKINNHHINHHLSRGQQKLWNIAMSLVQVEHFYQHTQKKCIWLIDDLASELDDQNFNKVIKMFHTKHAQFWFTAFSEHCAKFLRSLEDRGETMTLQLG